MKVSQYLAETNLFYPWTYIWYKNGLIKMVKKNAEVLNLVMTSPLGLKQKFMVVNNVK